MGFKSSVAKNPTGFNLSCWLGADLHLGCKLNAIKLTGRIKNNQSSVDLRKYKDLNPAGAQKEAIKEWIFTSSQQIIQVPLEQTALPLNITKPLNAADVWPAEIYCEFENDIFITVKA